MKKSKLLSFLSVASAAFFIGCVPALAQWQTPLETVPFGRGAGTGFNSNSGFTFSPSLGVLTAPAVTGTKTGGGSGSAFLASAAVPSYGWKATGQPADQKSWDAITIGNTLQFRAVNDANSSAGLWMNVARGAGATISGVTIPNLLRGVKSYGASGSATPTTGTINAASTSLTLGSAIDFVNGQGIIILQAGAAATVGAPTITTVAPVNATGATTYAYKLVSRDSSGGLSAATAATTIANGHATLGTYQVGTLGIVMNQITWTLGSGSPQCTGVYRSKSGGAYDFLGCFKGTSIYDSGLPAVTLTGFPAAPPAASQPQWLATTISSGAGTTTLTLANPAVTTPPVGTSVYHDDTAAILSAAAATSALYFPCGTYNVRGLQIPSTVRTITGDGSGCSVISSFSESAGSSGGGVSASMAGNPLTISGMKIAAALPMAFDGFALDGSVNAKIYGNEFVGINGLYIISSARPIIQGNHVSGWWNTGFFSHTNTDAEILGNTVGPISGQAGAVPISPAPPGSAYVWATGIVSIFGSGYHVADNLITPNGGVFGINAFAAITGTTTGAGGTVENNVVKSSGRECVSITGNNFKVDNNYCYWWPAGSGALASGDYGISVADDGVNPVTNGSISGNTIINSALSSISLAGSGVLAAPFTNVAIADNHLFGSNQMNSSYSAALEGILLYGRNVTGAVVSNNSFQSVSANMTYNVGEQDAGVGVPSGNVAILSFGSSGTAGYANMPGTGSKYYLAPVATGTILTTGSTIPTTALTGTLQAAQEPAHTGDVTNTAGSLALTLVTAQPAVHTWALAQTFTVAPVFTDQSGSRTALGLGTSATQNTGTSGANVPLLNGANTWSAGQTFSAAMTYGGVTLSNAVTGTGNMVLSASPTLTGAPLTTTAAVDTNTTQIASTAFVLAQAASATPLIDGTAAVGTSTRYARGDHVHPTDTSRAPIASPTFTGTVTIPTLAATTINAFTLAGTISGGGNQINNVVIGNSTPLAGSFTTLSASSTATFSGSLNFSTAITSNGILNLSGGDGAATFSNASMSLGFGSGNTYRHWIHTRHDTIAANNAIDFYTNDATLSGAGVFPTNGVRGLSIINGNISTPGYMASGTTTVSSLPTCNSGTKGARHFVTDANATTFNSTVAGSGANNVPVTCNGTNWVIGANDNTPSYLMRKYA